MQHHHHSTLVPLRLVKLVLVLLGVVSSLVYVATAAAFTNTLSPRRCSAVQQIAPAAANLHNIILSSFNPVIERRATCLGMTKNKVVHNNKTAKNLVLANALAATILASGIRVFPDTNHSVFTTASTTTTSSVMPSSSSSSVLVAGIEIVPSGGGGFGGLGITPFGVGPFGGFGFGFGIRPSSEPGVSIVRQQPPKWSTPMSKDEAIERAKAELEATRAKEKLLDAHIQELGRRLEEN